MKKPGFVTLSSIAGNLVLVGSLIHVYQTTSDTAFKTWVDQNILSTFTLILSASLVAGSFFGYFLLHKRAPRLSIGRLQRTGPKKLPAPFIHPNTSSALPRNFPVGPPPGPTSKHTAYAVPPLAKAPIQSPPRQPTNWLTAPKQWTPATFRAQRQEQREIPTPQEPSYQAQQLDNQQFSRGPGRPPPEEPLGNRQELPSTGYMKPTPPSQTPPPYTRETGQNPLWRTQSENQGNIDTSGLSYQQRPPESQPIPPYVRQTLGPRTDKTTGITQPSPQTSSQQSEPTAQSNRWTDPTSAQGLSLPRKWLSPSASPVPRSQTPMNPAFRPTQPNEVRQSLAGAQPQGAPRPLGYSAPIRPPQAGDIPRFRPEERRAIRPDNQPATPNIGPQIAGQRAQTDKVTGQTAGQFDPQRQPQPPPSRNSKAEEPVYSSSGTPNIPSEEMDWDTALDAILKTLRKDKVEEKP